jgi:hypothetical protein
MFIEIRLFMILLGEKRARFSPSVFLETTL